MFKRNIKNIFKLIIFIFLLTNLLISFALSNATISLDKEKYDINDPINIKISIQSEWWWDIEISNIKWIDDFLILWKSQSSSTQIEVINWKTVTALSNILNLQLQAKQKWNYELWPVSVKEWNKEIQTNSVKIEVSWDKMFINNTINNIWNSTNSIWTNPPNTNSIWNNNNEIENIQASVEKKDFGNDTIYLFLIIVVLLWWWLIFVLKNNSELLKKLNSKKNLEKETKENQVMQQINFEDEKKEIVIPELTDIDFLDKINDVFKDKISKKYNIDNIQNMTYDEILNSLNIEEREDLEPIIKLIIKAKYSNIVSDNNKLLNLIKEI